MANIQPAIKAEINKRIGRIKANINNLHDARTSIIEDMLYLQQHKKDIKAITGKSFDELIKDMTGHSRRYYNQLLANYKFLKKYERVDLFDKIDIKVIEHIKKTNKPALLDKAETMTRDDITVQRDGRRSPVFDADFTIEDDDKIGRQALQNAPETAGKAWQESFFMAKEAIREALRLTPEDHRKKVKDELRTLIDKI